MPVYRHLGVHDCSAFDHEDRDPRKVKSGQRIYIGDAFLRARADLSFLSRVSKKFKEHMTSRTGSKELIPSRKTTASLKMSVCSRLNPCGYLTVSLYQSFVPVKDDAMYT